MLRLRCDCPEAPGMSVVCSGWRVTVLHTFRGLYHPSRRNLLDKMSGPKVVVGVLGFPKVVCCLCMGAAVVLG